MSSRKGKRRRSKAKGQVSKKHHVDRTKEVEPEQLGRRERYFDIFVIAALFAFGVYNSILYFGHRIIPNPDFTVISRVGRELLSLQIPTSFKYAPVVGSLQTCLSYLLGGQHPHLTAGWLLNAILHPFNLILLWLVGREVVGKSALWIAIVAILNPYVLYLLTEPIAETSFLFFILLTFYFIFKRSNWSYLLASITTMVRYEGAALILAAFVMDMIYCKSRRERIRAFLYSALASVPLALWLLGTILTLKPGATHYLNVLFAKKYAEAFAQPVESRTGLVLHMKLLWLVGFRPLLTAYPGAGETFGEMVWKLTKVFAVIGFFFGCIYGLYKRQWKILALLTFFVPYFVLHARYPYPIQRFHATIFWIALLLCWFGLQSCWKLIDKDGRVPKGLAVILQVLVAIIAIVWLARLFPYLPKISSRLSPTSASVPYVAMSLVTLIFAVRLFIYKFRCVPREFCILALSCLVIASNQFVLVHLVGDGETEKEFKLLADWYAAKAKPGEKLGVYMASVVRIFVPERADCILPLPKADNPSEFVKACYEKDITYVVWATREGQHPRSHTGYRRLGLHKNIDILKEPRGIGPYEFVRKISAKRGWVHIFRLHRPADGVKQKL